MSSAPILQILLTLTDCNNGNANAGFKQQHDRLFKPRDTWPHLIFQNI